MKYFQFHNPGHSLAPLLVFMNAGVVEGGGSWKRVGPHGPHEGSGSDKIKGNMTMRKDVWFFSLRAFVGLQE